MPAREVPVAELIASGKLLPATVGGPLPRPVGPVRHDHEAGELLREWREDERY